MKKLEWLLCTLVILSLTRLSKTDETCRDGEYKCLDGKRCIPPEFICDGHRSCRDRSDDIAYDNTTHTIKDGVPCRGMKYKQKICLLPANQAHKNESLCRADTLCGPGEFECADRKFCLDAKDICDGHEDCDDGSDEVHFNASIHTPVDGIACRGKSYKRNFCLLPSDQAHKNKTLCNAGDSCEPGYFECADRSRCIWKDSFCDHSVTCSDKSDEIKYDRHQAAAEDGIECLGHDNQRRTSCLLPRKYVCDGAANCYDKSDECLCDGSYIGEDCFRCLDRKKVIPILQMCDGIFHCYDLSDECLCTDNIYKPVGQICGQVKWDDNPTIFCKDDPLSTNFTIEKICDGNVDCTTNREDEEYCEKEQVQCTDDESVSAPKCNYKCEMGAPDRVRTCDGRFKCTTLFEECRECENSSPACQYMWNVNGFFLCPSDGSVIYGMNICDGVSDCPNGTDEMLCAHKFYCNNSLTDNIPIEKKCDFITDCKDSSDELDCRNATNKECKNEYNNQTGDNCYLTHFYCDDDGDTIYIDRTKKVCDGNEDCLSGADECQSCTQDFFSNDDWLISSMALIPFLWLISVSAVVGNIFVISSSGAALIREGGNMSKNEKLQRILVLNLSFADFLVGMYTLMMSILNIVLSSNGYCRQENVWRSSLSCSVLGACVVAGSEASVFALTIITAVRVNAVNRPLETISIRSVGALLALGWIVSLAFAVIPLSPSLDEYFVEGIWYKENLLGTNMGREDLTRYTNIMVPRMNISQDFIVENGEVGSWSLYEALMRKLNPTYIAQRRFGYYSTHGVCLPRLFPDKREDASWAFSLAIILINFSAFIFIFVGYVVLYKKATQVTVSERAATNRGLKLQRKLTVIVLTDFCCWMPICVMAFLQLNEIDIPKQVYVPAGTILIPINSALNPILYSNVPDWLGKKLSPLRAWLREHVLVAWERCRTWTSRRIHGTPGQQASAGTQLTPINRAGWRRERGVVETVSDQVTSDGNVMSGTLSTGLESETGRTSVRQQAGQQQHK